MAYTQSFTGRYGNATVGGVSIPITGWTAKLRKAFADSTDSNNYDPVTQQLFTTQQPGVIGIDGTVSGYFDFGGTTDAQLMQSFKTDGPFQVTLGLTRTVNFATGLFSFTDVDFTISVPAATMVAFSLTIKSYGIITLF